VKALVTGGGGFLGKAIVAKLLERGDTVRSFARGDYPELVGWGVETMRGDLADPEAVMRAHEGCDIVFHVAGKPDMWGPYDAYRLTNLVGTDNVIAACRTQGVPRLVYTSTPSVVHAGGDIEGADESLAYAQRFTSPYPETKAEAERHVLLANGATLATVAIRPHLVWGPGDNHLIPRLLERARLGRMRYIGREDKLIDTTYVDNAADAHLAAGDRLAPEADCAGKAYFLSQGDPWPASKISNAILAAAGLPPVTRRLPTWFAYGLGAILESAYRMLRIEAEPAVTRFLVQQMSTAHWYDISAARRDLGYEPRISIEEGFAKLRLHFEREARGGTSSHGG
jgi:nucleoside-diphosphate-sugar epimerase